MWKNKTIGYATINKYYRIVPKFFFSKISPETVVTLFLKLFQKVSSKLFTKLPLATKSWLRHLQALSTFMCHIDELTWVQILNFASSILKASELSKILGFSYQSSTTINFFNLERHSGNCSKFWSKMKKEQARKGFRPPSAM